MYQRPKAQQLTPELAKQMLHNTDFYIGLRREYAAKGIASACDMMELARYENERQALIDYLKEQES